MKYTHRDHTQFVCDMEALSLKPVFREDLPSGYLGPSVLTQDAPFVFRHTKVPCTWEINLDGGFVVHPVISDPMLEACA